MAKLARKRTIRSNVYEFYYLSPLVAMRVLTRLLKMVAEPVGLLAGAATRSGVKEAAAEAKNAVKSLVDGNIPPDTIARAAKALVERMDEAEVVQTIETVLATVHVQTPSDKGTRPVNVETDFEGAIGEMLEVIVAAAEVNFGSFFDEATGGAEAAAKT